VAHCPPEAGPGRVLPSGPGCSVGSGPDPARTGGVPPRRSWPLLIGLPIVNGFLVKALLPDPNTPLTVPYTVFRTQAAQGNVVSIYSRGTSTESRFAEPVTWPPPGEATPGKDTGAGPAPRTTPAARAAPRAGRASRRADDFAVGGPQGLRGTCSTPAAACVGQRGVSRRRGRAVGSRGAGPQLRLLCVQVSRDGIHVGSQPVRDRASGLNLPRCIFPPPFAHLLERHHLYARPLLVRLSKRHLLPRVRHLASPIPASFFHKQ
jgi:hypothetical protein